MRVAGREGKHETRFLTWMMRPRIRRRQRQREEYAEEEKEEEMEVEFMQAVQAGRGRMPN